MSKWAKLEIANKILSRLSAGKSLEEVAVFLKGNVGITPEEKTAATNGSFGVLSRNFFKVTNASLFEKTASLIANLFGTFAARPESPQPVPAPDFGSSVHRPS